MKRDVKTLRGSTKSEPREELEDQRRTELYVSRLRGCIYRSEIRAQQAVVCNGYADENYTLMDGGGGIFCYYSSPTITNCIISGNSAHGRGGGVRCSRSNPTITNCIIKDYVYGIYNYKTTAAYIAHNKITQGEYGIVTFEAYNDAIRYNYISYNTEYGAKDYDSQLKNCFNWNTFKYNRVGYCYDPTVDLSTLEFDGNIMEDNDIAIKVENASTISITPGRDTGRSWSFLNGSAAPAWTLSLRAFPT